MNFSDAYQETLFRFRLKAADISAQSGISESQLSQFKGGKNIRISTLEGILRGLPDDARLYLLTLVAHGINSTASDTPPPPNQPSNPE